ncbi:hypothetical protein BWQ96_00563 [Gracilariopsis chorda]|uniref:Uncharacterized protein n=1 Tax=Gracilariopsis chorda TaxID=448386 RepID=A0A2V3J5K5_9FLOR|nr:hypothetical protein BWQ96_00563 [Gracilariopsis chorda]|eukprot:PXF49685.1 hypothetical protein BWQ96_00563 [Gracilariopsis chorda]
MGSRTLQQSFIRSLATKASKKNLRNSEIGDTEKLLIEVLRPVVPPPPRTEEERKHLRQLMIRYGKLKRRHFIEMEVRQREFLRAKWTALNALPHARRVEAMTSPTEDLPTMRPLMTDTPPIKDFNVASMTKK